jgi:hypothetical protein
MDEPLGALQEVSSTPDRTLYAYRRRHRWLRGVAWVGLALLLLGVAIVLGRPAGRWYSWLFAVLPSIAASAAAFCGMLDLLNRPLFRLEVDRRARTLSLSMPREHGQALAKLRFADVSRVEVRQKGPPPVWNVTLLLNTGKRIGLGVSDDAAASLEVARRFSELVGAELVESPRTAEDAGNG